GPHATAKDVALHVLSVVGVSGAVGYAVEFAGECVRAMQMEERMTLCNLAIELGARFGMIAPDETTFAYLKGRPFAPQGAAFDEAVRHWAALASRSEEHTSELQSREKLVCRLLL